MVKRLSTKLRKQHPYATCLLRITLHHMIKMRIDEDLAQTIITRTSTHTALHKIHSFTVDDGELQATHVLSFVLLLNFL